MSKLSDYAAKKEGLRLNEYNKKEVIAKLYDKISNLEFKVYKYENEFVLVVDDFLIKISDSKTSGYGLYYSTDKDIIKNLKDEKNWYYIDNINKDEEYVDIKDLLIYCENEAVPLKLNRTKLNEEIDNGFRKQDVIFGRNTLEEDVKFNEWLHRKMY